MKRVLDSISGAVYIALFSFISYLLSFTFQIGYATQLHIPQYFITFSFYDVIGIIKWLMVPICLALLFVILAYKVNSTGFLWFHKKSVIGKYTVFFIFLLITPGWHFIEQGLPLGKLLNAIELSIVPLLLFLGVVTYLLIILENNQSRRSFFNMRTIVANAILTLIILFNTSYFVGRYKAATQCIYYQFPLNIKESHEQNETTFPEKRVVLKVFNSNQILCANVDNNGYIKSYSVFPLSDTEKYKLSLRSIGPLKADTLK